MSADPRLAMKIYPYEVVGRAMPTEAVQDPKIFRMKIFARDTSVAKSRFWYFMKKLNKVKRTAGETLSVKKLKSGSGETVKNYAIWLRYDSRTSTHNMYKEYRDVTEAGAVSQMYAEMTGRHSALHQSIQIMRIAEISDDALRRPHAQQLTKQDLKFPIIMGPQRLHRREKTTFARKAPTTFMH